MADRSVEFLLFTYISLKKPVDFQRAFLMFQGVTS